MAIPAVCPRCQESLRAPELMTPGWQCPRHGKVAPLQLPPANERTLRQLADMSDVPVWMPDPPPHSWLVTGLGRAGDHEGVTATVVALSGPSPLGGAADLLLVAEEPGVGLGAGYAGLAGPDAGVMAAGPSDATVLIDSHPTLLWQVPEGAADRVAFVGEAEGCWLWLIFWPQDADVLLLEHLALCDYRSHSLLPVEFGAPTPRLTSTPIRL